MLAIPEKYWHIALPCALLVYCLCSFLAILQQPGLQYDEALLIEGAVQMRISTQELALPHDPNTWVCPVAQCFPLMTVRYVGSLKEFLCLPLFMLFGPDTIALRVLSMLLGALGIFGIARLIRQQAGLPAAALTAWVLALNPAYVAMTTFDNDAIAMSMAALGVLCLAITAYLRNRTVPAAFWTGAAMALLVWARANLVWMLAALIVATAIVLRERLRLPLSHVAAALLGGLIAGLPFLVYQILSKGGTWEGLSIFASSETLAQRLLRRLILFSESLLSDREHRAMWNGPEMPGWQYWLFPAVVVLSCLACLIGRRAAFSRILVLAFLLFAVPLFFARVNLSEHHLIGLLPFAAAMAVLASGMAAERYRWLRVGSIALALVYAGSALFWQTASIRGLAKTGGVGPWSDGIYRLATYLEDKYKDREIKILDWGLQDNLFVLTDGSLHTRDIFDNATYEKSGLGRSWTDEIREGGVFLLNSFEHRQFPIVSEAFLKALNEAHAAVQRFEVRQRDGVTFAEVIDIQPNSLGQGSVSSPVTTSFEGLHEPEASGWRWTKQHFSLTFAGTGARLILKLYVPDSIIQKLGPITLTARAGAHALAPETFRQPGEYTFTRDLPAGANRIDFALDKSLPPSPSDDRELGIVVVSASLEN